MPILSSLRKWLGQTGFIKKILAEPADLSMFRTKPSVQFILGMGIVGLSYLMAWPLITVLGAISIYFSRPALFLIGSPVAYVVSHIVFLVGMAIAGKDSIKYIHAVNRWLLYRLACKLSIKGE